MKIFRQYGLLAAALGALLLVSQPVQAAPQAAAVIDDGYAGNALQKILNTGKLKFGQKMRLRLSLDDQGNLIECRGVSGADASQACAAAKAASPFGVPPYGVPTYLTIALWTGQPPKAQAAPANEKVEASARTEANAKTTDSAPAAWLAKVRRKLRDSMYIPEKTKPGTYHVTAQITYDAAGKILESSIVKSSGDKLLDKYCLQGIKRAGQIPAPPQGTGSTTDITFTLKRL